MNKVMLLPSPPSSGSIGSVTKCLGIAKILIKNNCKVCFVIGGELKKFIESQNFKVYDYPVPTVRKIAININNAIDFMEWTGMVEEEFAKESILAELAAIEDFNPDVIFSETRLSSSISARIAKIPTVMIAAWPCSSKFPENIIDNKNHTKIYNKQLTYYGLDNIGNITELLYEFADVRVAPTIPQLEPELDPKSVKFLGYILDMKEEKHLLPEWYKNWIDLPQIFIYLSVGPMLPELYIKIVIDIFKDLPFRVICSCGFHYSLEQLPSGLSNIKFVKYISVPSIIKDTSLVIFHGGQDTMLTSLYHGIPSITIPGNHFERDYNATNLERLGVSKKLSLYSFRKNSLVNEIDKIMGSCFIEQCKKYKKIMKTYQGTETCADIIQQQIIL